MKNKKILLIILSIMLVVAISTGVSYSIWSKVDNLDKVNKISTDCLELSLDEANEISLEKSVPLTENEGSSLIPYTFTLKNICNKTAEYKVNLETLGDSTIDSSFLREKLNDEDSIKLSDISLNRIINIPGATDSRVIATGNLMKDEEITYNLRIWLDEDTLVEDSAGKIYRGKIVVNSTLNTDDFVITLNTNGGQMKLPRIVTKVGNELGTLPKPSKDGYIFSAWYSDPELTNQVTNETIVTNELTNLYAKYFAYAEGKTTTLLDGNTANKAMKNLFKSYPVSNYTDQDGYVYYIKRSFILVNSDNIISTTDSDVPVYIWRDNNTLYYYTEAKKIFLNADSKGLFANFANLRDIDLSGFDFSNVTTIEDMFAYDYSLKKLDLSSIDTSNVTNMSGTFAALSGLTTLDVSNLNTSKVTNMASMFTGCSKLTELDISMFDTSKVESMINMFQAMRKLERLNVSNLNTSNVRDMGGMFNGLNNIEYIDISTWDTSNVRSTSYKDNGDYYGMFADCPKLKKIYVGYGWKTSKIRNSVDMFKNSTLLVGGEGTIYDETKIDVAYAHVDGGTSNPGYLTFRQN